MLDFTVFDCGLKHNFLCFWRKTIKVKLEVTQLHLRKSHDGFDFDFRHILSWLN